LGTVKCTKTARTSAKEVGIGGTEFAEKGKNTGASETKGGKAGRKQPLRET